MIENIKAWFADRRARKEAYSRYEEWVRGYNPFICGYTPKGNGSGLPVAPKGGTGELCNKTTARFTKGDE